MEATKYCGSCQSTKSVNDFNKSTRYGYQSKCKSCSVEQVKEWTANNRDRVNERERLRLINNPQRRIGKCVHMRLTNTLRKGTYTRQTAEIIGLTQVQFLDWTAFNFEGDMIWSNYGSLWEFDLIIPASAYDLTIEQQLLAAFNWCNIRPCLKSDNAAKHNFILPFAQANQSIRVLAFIRKMRQNRLEAF